jgi:hypothetical protein
VQLKLLQPSRSLVTVCWERAGQARHAGTGLLPYGSLQTQGQWTRTQDMGAILQCFVANYDTAATVSCPDWGLMKLGSPAPIVHEQEPTAPDYFILQVIQ